MPITWTDKDLLPEMNSQEFLQKFWQERPLSLEGCHTIIDAIKICAKLVSSHEILVTCYLLGEEVSHYVITSQHKCCDLTYSNVLYKYDMRACMNPNTKCLVVNGSACVNTTGGWKCANVENVEIKCFKGAFEC